MRILLDTSVIIRFCQTEDPQHQTVLDAVTRLSEFNHELCIVPQVIYELWSVATRPIKANGLGRTTDDMFDEVGRLCEIFKFLKDERTVYDYWIELVHRFSVGGRNSHDTRLVAAMDRHAISHLLTLDKKDFKRFTHKTVWLPEHVLTAAEGE